MITKKEFIQQIIGRSQIRLEKQKKINEKLTGVLSEQQITLIKLEQDMLNSERAEDYLLTDCIRALQKENYIARSNTTEVKKPDYRFEPQKTYGAFKNSVAKPSPKNWDALTFNFAGKELLHQICYQFGIDENQTPKTIYFQLWDIAKQNIALKNQFSEIREKCFNLQEIETNKSDTIVI